MWTVRRSCKRQIFGFARIDNCDKSFSSTFLSLTPIPFPHSWFHSQFSPTPFHAHSTFISFAPLQNQENVFFWMFDVLFYWAGRVGGYCGQDLPPVFKRSADDKHSTPPTDNNHSLTKNTSFTIIDLDTNTKTKTNTCVNTNTMRVGWDTWEAKRQGSIRWAANWPAQGLAHKIQNHGNTKKTQN